MVSERLRIAGALAICLGLAAPARAQEADAGTRVAARELAEAGAEAFEKQDYATALDRFQRAEQLYKVPSIAVWVARCLARTGRVVEAVDKYEETLRMPLDASAPEAFQRAVADANAEVDSARARVARLELHLPTDAPASAQVFLDERAVPPALIGVATPVNPGTHRVVARAPDKATYSNELVLAEGGRQVVQIVLAPEAPPAPAPTPASTASHRPSTLTIALLAGGGLALTAGTVTGIAALNHKSALDSGCDPGCPANLQSDLDAFRLNRTLSYVGFGVGLAAAGAGVYLLLHQGSSGGQVGALVLPGGAGVSGRF